MGKGQPRQGADTICGTWNCFSPEMAMNAIPADDRKHYGTESDWYMLGCVAYELNARWYAFDYKNDVPGDKEKMLRNIKKVNAWSTIVTWPVWTEPDWKELVEGLCAWDPATRLGTSVPLRNDLGDKLADIRGGPYLHKLPIPEGHVAKTYAQNHQSVVAIVHEKCPKTVKECWFDGF